MPQVEPTRSSARVLIVAESGRAIAQAASRAGFTPVTLTVHDDADLLSIIAGGARVPHLGPGMGQAELAALAAQLAPPPVPLVYGGALEARPGLLRRIARGREVLGADAAVLTTLLDPIAFAQRLRRLGIPHPAVTEHPAACGDGWLIKRSGSCGGRHVRVAEPRLRLNRHDYGQRRVPGRPVSALVAGDGRRAVTLGLSGQWPLGSRALPYLFTGVVVPAAIQVDVAASLNDAAASLAADIGLRGLGSVDAMVDGDRWWVLEINPRLGGSLDAWWLATGADLFRLHVEACRGGLPEGPLAVRRVGASRCVFAPSAVRARADSWPSWVADRPRPDTVIRGHGPICTVMAEGDDRQAVLAQLEHRARTVLVGLTPAVTHGDSRRSSVRRSNAGAARASAPDAVGW